MILVLEQKNEDRVPFAIGRSEKGCNIFSGQWVRDNESQPLYKESECPYLQSQQTCLANGRPDRDYLYWKWQPHGCSVPRYATIEFFICYSFLKLEYVICVLCTPRKYFVLR